MSIPVPRDCPPGIIRFWIAYNDDWSKVFTFRQEVEALRYAMKQGFKVAPASFRGDLREQAARHEEGEQ